MMVWYLHLLKNFPYFAMSHTVQGLVNSPSIVQEYLVQV